MRNELVKFFFDVSESKSRVRGFCRDKKDKKKFRPSDAVHKVVASVYGLIVRSCRSETLELNLNGCRSHSAARPLRDQ